MTEIHLTLPLPPSPNGLASHPMVRHREKRAYQRGAWIAACRQSRPPAEPPAKVRLDAHFRLFALRDEDNLQASLKWVVDSLRQAQAARRWRDGIYADRGYFVDDNPAHLELGEVTQEVDRKNRGVTLTIRPLTI